MKLFAQGHTESGEARLPFCQCLPESPAPALGLQGARILHSLPVQWAEDSGAGVWEALSRGSLLPSLAGGLADPAGSGESRKLTNTLIIMGSRALAPVRDQEAGFVFTYYFITFRV